MAEEADETEDKFGLDRVVFFSDAVIAIAITLLVLEIRVPELEDSVISQRLTADVLALWPKYVGYVTSFWVIGTYWLAHHRTFRRIADYDGGLLVLNLVFLMFVAFLPYPTALLFSYPARVVSVVLYAGTVAAIGFALTCLWWYAVRSKRLVPKPLDAYTVRAATVSLLATPLVFLGSVAIAFWNAQLAMYSWLVIIPIYLLYRPLVRLSLRS